MDGIRTDIYLNDRLHNSRIWPAVPRVGDLMWVYNVFQSPRRTSVHVADWCIVEQVRWLDTGKGDLSHVDIYVKHQPTK